jgi:uncharacterized damage-inducible protein DinB
MKSDDGPPSGFPADLYCAHGSYNRWMNHNVYDAAARLSDEQRKRDMGAFFRSIHITLNHILVADRAWLARFGCPASVCQSLDEQGRAIRITGLDQDVYPSFETLGRERERTDGDIEEFVSSLTVEGLRSPLEYRTSKGEKWRHPLWWAIAHFFNHQTHHRGQVTTLLKQLGVDPGTTDLVILLREQWCVPEATTG